MKITGPIIVVDDDQDDHDLLKDVCQNLGVCHFLKFFYNGMAVLKYLKTSEERPFIILCDINMPNVNGLELRRSIMEDEKVRQKSIPFVFFSTSASESQVKEAYEDLTVQGFFLKEGSFTELEKTMRLIFEYWGKCKHP